MFYYESDSINELNLSVRSCNALNRAGILTVGDLQSLSEEDLWKIKNLGAKSVQEILHKKAKMEVDLGLKREVTPVSETAPSFLGNDGIT